MLHRSSGDTEVAIKTLPMDADEQDKIKLLQEAAIMGQFKHPNIVHIHGVIVQDDPVSLQNIAKCVTDMPHMQYHCLAVLIVPLLLLSPKYSS